MINVSTTTPLYVKETGESSQSVSYSISYPTAGSALTAAESLDWVSTPSVGETEVTFTVSNQTHGDIARYGIITLNYPNANPVSFYVSQEGKVHTLSQTDWAGDGFNAGNTWATVHPGSATTINRTIYSNRAMSYYITALDATIGSHSKTNLNSLTLNVGSSSKGSDTYTAACTGDVSNGYTLENATKPQDNSWKDQYYSLVFNIQFTNKNNGELVFNSAVFYGYIIP